MPLYMKIDNTKIDNAEDVIDTRDILNQIKRLERDEKDEGRSEEGDAELLSLRKLVNVLLEIGGEPLEDGVPLVRYDYFEDYAKELADDMGDVRSEQWPLNHIDWEAAIEELQQDYASVDFDGVEYFVEIR